MALDFPTLGLVLLITGILSSAIMIIMWRVTQGEAGTALLALAATISVFGYLSLCINARFATLSIIISNITTVVTPLLVFEGTAQFKRYTKHFSLRLTSHLLILLLTTLWTLTHLESARARYVVNDLVVVLILIAAIILLLHQNHGAQRTVYILISATFAMMALAFAYRWVFSLAREVEGGLYHNHMSLIILLTLVPWTFGWTYGFVLLINIKAHSELHSTARRDPLTGLYNRLWMREYFETDLRTIGRLCLVILDIDGFKRINDGMGHLVGDQILVAFAALIASSLESGDHLLRYGGDEFILLLTKADPMATIQAITDRLDEPLLIEGQSIALTFSYGWATYPEDGASFDHLFTVADQRMYQHKRHGP